MSAGPWSVQQLTFGRAMGVAFDVLNEKGQVIFRGRDGRDEFIPQRKAVAELAAAAPELQAALRELSDATDAYMAHPTDASASWRAAEARFRIARSDALLALAKSEGRTA